MPKAPKSDLMKAALDSKIVILEDDGEIEDPGVPTPSRAIELAEKQGIIDHVAAHLFVRGWPEQDVYRRAEAFWRLRTAHLGKGKLP